jgi:phenylalanyl-tRNA synthetase beta chain
MKIIYSHLKQFLPDLDIKPSKLRDDITLIGHFTNYFETVPPLVKEGSGEIDYVFDLDIKVNRGDCLGYYGLARDLAVFYNLKLNIPQIPTLNFNTKNPSISINSTDVSRIQAVKLTGVINSTSPQWLTKFLTLHQINPINLVVDLTNYIMILYGIPCHAFDIAKTSDSLIWENNLNNKYPKFTTLDGTVLKLDPQNLVITNSQQPLSLSFIGGKNSGIDLSTKDVILEMAIYNRVRVRTDSKNLKTVTEASIRLEKHLDPETIPLAFSQLIYLIQKHTKATIGSSLFDHYPQPVISPKIDFDPQFPSLISGINIPTDFSINCLTNLGCVLSPLARPATARSRRSPATAGEGSGKGFVITPPSIRPDLTLSHDLAEEVIRFYGYHHIPTNQPLPASPAPDITPKILHLVEMTKDKLVSLGYDEVLSWPLVSTALDPKTIVSTQDNINSNFPYLRQNIIQSLKPQVDQYLRLKLNKPQIFEIGKIYFQTNNQYTEKYALGMYHPSLPQLQKDLDLLGLKPVAFDDNYAQIILDDQDFSQIKPYIPQSANNSAYELTHQLIILDANQTFDAPQDPQKLLASYQQKINPDVLWSIEIIDIYSKPEKNIFRYTFRVTYFNTTDKTAKKTHLTAFNLN